MCGIPRESKATSTVPGRRDNSIVSSTGRLTTGLSERVAVGALSAVSVGVLSVVPVGEGDGVTVRVGGSAVLVAGTSVCVRVGGGSVEVALGRGVGATAPLSSSSHPVRRVTPSRI